MFITGLKKCFAYLCLLALISCKKETGGPGGFVASSAAPTQVDAFISITKKVTYGPGYVRQNYEQTDAVFYDSLFPADQLGISHGVNAGTVTVANKTMYRIVYGLNNDSIFYSVPSNYDRYVYPLSISISGSPNFPKMDVIEKREEPVFNDYYKVPDTFYCSRSNSVTLGDVQNFDNIQVVMETMANNHHVLLYKETIKAPVNDIVFSKLQMDTVKQNLGSATTGSLFITFNSRDFIKQNGKIIEVSKGIQYSKEQIYFKH